MPKTITLESKTITHELMAKHSRVSEAEKNALLKRYHIEPKALPKILKDDPAILHLNLKKGDLVKIVRKSQTSGVANYYREVI